MTLLIRNGEVVSPAGAIAQDVLIDGEKIIALYAPGRAPEGPDVLDATGKYVIPGAIDAHTHMQMPFGAPRRATRSSRAIWLAGAAVDCPLYIVHLCPPRRPWSRWRRRVILTP